MEHIIDEETGIENDQDPTLPDEGTGEDTFSGRFGRFLVSKKMV